MLTVSAIKAFSDNYIWAITDQTQQKACIVDPGDAQPVIEFLESEGLDLESVIVTHHHPDHIGGIKTLRENYNFEVIGSESSRYQPIDRPLKDGDSIKILGQNFKMMQVPGHTLDHVAYYSEANEKHWLFCGDTLFSAGCGRMFEGEAKQMHQSLLNLAALPSETLVYCAHEYTLANLQFAVEMEPDNQALLDYREHCEALRQHKQPTIPTSIERERAVNPFLRCDSPSIRASLKLPEVEDWQVFKALRKAKDQF